jgi:hypothetical protein
MKKLVKTLATAIMTLALTATSVTAIAETTETDSPYYFGTDNLSPLQIQLIREEYEYYRNYFMPDSWFIYNTAHGFYKTLSVRFVDEYELNLDDFSDINFVEFISTPNSKYPNSYEISFNSFDDLYYARLILLEMPVFEYVGGFMYAEEMLYPAFQSDIKKYGIIEYSN